MRERGGLFAIFAALMAAVAHVGSGAGPKNTEDLHHGPIAKASQPGEAEEALLRVFTQFGKSEEFHSPLIAGHGCSGASAILQSRGRSGFRWALATVPDPEHSRMQLDFDREIEAIQNAAENANYRLERYWFPWRSDNELAKHADSEAAAKNATHDDDQRYRLPGVLLFNHVSDASVDGALAIFLVDESPVSGIDPEQFRNAVCYGESLPTTSGDNGRQLSIIGPGFSGSFASLAQLIEDPKLCPASHSSEKGSGRVCFDRVVLRSWTSDYKTQKKFADHWLPATRATPPLIKPDLKTLTAPSLYSINCFVSHVRNAWNDNGPIVLLVEGGTTFGAQVSGASNPLLKRQDDSHESPRRPENGCSADPDNLKIITQEKVFTLAFPRNISTLRNATESESALPGFGKESTKRDLPHTGLLFSLRGDEAASAEIPTYSKQQTPVSQESVLLSLSALLKNDVVHYVGIVASDSLDRLFLSRYLRSASPNLRVFLFDSDLLLEHGSDSADYAGTLAVTTSPLSTISQLWTGATNSFYVFPNSGAEEIYNSAAALLWAIGDPKEKEHKDGPLLRDYQNPFLRSTVATAPLWISVASRSGYQPVTVLSPDRSPLSLEAPTHNGMLMPEYWPGWGYALYALFTACLFFCFLLCWASPSGNRNFAIFSAKPNEPDPLARGFYLSAMGCCLSALIAVWMVVPGTIVKVQLLFVSGGPLYPLGQAPLLYCTGAVGMLLAWSSRTLLRSMFAGKRRALPNGSANPAPAVLQATAGCSLGLLAFGFITLPEHPSSSSPVLGHLATMFSLACVALGAMMTASLLPLFEVVGAWAGNRKDLSLERYFKRPFWRVPYFWSTVLINLIVVGIAAAAGLAIFHRTNNGSQFLAACRAIKVTSGVSPLTPATFLLVALLSLAFVQLRRLTFYEDRCPNVPILYRDVFCPKLLKTVRDIRERTRVLSLHPVHIAALIVLLLVCVQVFYHRSFQTFETPGLEAFLLGLAIAVAFFLLLVWIRFMLVWSAFNEFLQQLERHPLRNVFSLLPRGFVWSPVWQGGGKKRTHVAITRSLECVMALNTHARTPPALQSYIALKLDALQKQVVDLLRLSAARQRTPRDAYRHLESSLSKIAQRAARELDRSKWPRGGYESKAELSTREETREALHVPPNIYQQEEPEAICGELIAFRFLAFVNYVMTQLDNLVGFLSFGFLLLVVALNSYDFRSSTIIDWMLILMFAVMTAGIVSVFSQADRDPILSRITGTEEGKLDRHFFKHLVSYGGMPALALAATHFPSVGKFFFSWVKPALEAIH